MWRCVGTGHSNPATVTIGTVTTVTVTGNGHNGNGHDLNGVAGDARPDFLCVGAQKAGTSWLYQQLEPHPDFWMPPVKELHYFDQSKQNEASFILRAAETSATVRFLDSMKNLSAQSYLDLDNYGRLFQS